MAHGYSKRDYIVVPLRVEIPKGAVQVSKEVLDAWAALLSEQVTKQAKALAAQTLRYFIIDNNARQKHGLRRLRRLLLRHVPERAK